MSATLQDYLPLITSEHTDKPQFVEVVSTLLQFSVDLRNTLDGMVAHFDVDTAAGVQLDALGAWVGVARVVTVVPSAAYPTPSVAYQAAFSDDVYRRLIKARSMANAWDGTPEGAQAVLAAFYDAAGTHAAIYDNQDMSVTLLLTGAPPTALEAAVLSQFLLPLRPMGVGVKQTITPPAGGPLFGVDYENDFIAGADVGSFGSPF